MPKLNKHSKPVQKPKKKLEVKVDSKSMSVEILKKEKIEDLKKKAKKIEIKEKPIIKEKITIKKIAKKQKPLPEITKQAIEIEDKIKENELPILETPSAIIDYETIEKEIIDEQKEHEEKLEQEIIEETSKTNKSLKKEKKKPEINSNEIKNQQSLDKSDYKNQIEALLFACGKAMSVDMICELTGIDKRNVKKSLEELQKDYELRNNSLNIYEESDSWKINVREKYLHLVRKIVADTELPRSTMETLAVIAWKTPIYQSEIVRIRGNKCYDHIAELEELGFVSKDKKGRSFILKVTDKFFNYFDIDHGNLKQILDEIKKPIMEQEKATTQATLNGLEVVDTTIGEENQTTQEIFDKHERELLGKLEVIEIRKRITNEDDAKNQESFFNDFDKRISDVSKRTDDITADMPKRNIFAQSETEEGINTENLEQGATAETDETSDPNPQSIELNSIPEHHPLKPKSMTKKQLEKKYKDELIKVKEKMDKKK